VSDPKPPENGNVIRVLHVDDDPLMLEISQQILTGIEPNLEIDQASCVDEAFKKISNNQYDVIVSDYEMPLKNGLQFLKELVEKKSEIPFILFTGKGREEVAIKALNLGASGYFNKQGSPQTVYGELAHGIKAVAERAMIKTLAKNAEEALKRTNERVDRIIESITDGIAAVDKDWTLLYINEKMAKVAKLTAKQMVGKNVWGNLPFLVGTPFEKNVKEAMQKQKPARFEFASTKTGIFWQVLVYPSPDGLAVVCRDITEQKKSEKDLLQAKEDWERTFDSVPDYIAIISNQHKIVRVNKAMAQQLGVTPEQAIGLNCYECVHEKSQPPDFCPHKQTVIDGNEHIVEIHESHLGGDFIVSTTPLKDAKGKTIGSVHVARNITERKKAEDELSSSEAKYRALVENADDAIILTDLDGNPLYRNPAYFKSLGFEEKEKREPDGLDRVHPDDLPFLKKNIKDIKKTHSTVTEYRSMHKNGSWMYKHAKSVLISDEKGEPTSILTIIRDITERKKTEEALADSEAKYRALVENADDAIVLTDLRGMYIYRNSAYYRSLGFEKDEDTESDGFARVHPDDLPTVRETIPQLLKTGYSTVEYRVKHRNGSWIYRHSKSVLIRNRHSEPYAILAIIRDVTERKKTEEKLAQVNEKLRVVGKLTRHDVRNRLSVIRGNVYLLNKKFGTDPTATKCLSDINSAVILADRLFEFSRLYERIGAEEQTNIDVSECFNEATELFTDMRNITVSNECAGLTIVADSMLRQLFYNIIENSLRHGEKVTQIRLHHKKEDTAIKLIYEDDGIGVPAENKTKLFTEGFSTNDGTGLGLAIVKKMVQVYGWTITEEGTPGKGVKFVMTIPQTSTSGQINYKTQI